MSENIYFRKSFKICLELCKDRGYKVDDKYKNLTDIDITYLINNNTLDIIGTKDTNNLIYIKFINIHKVKLSYIQDIIDKIYEKNKNTTVLLALKSKPSSIVKKLETKGNNNIQIFHCKYLQINPTKHNLVPHHIKLSKPEEELILEKYNILIKSQLPNLLQTDPISRYYNFKKGDIIKIVSKHKHSYKKMFNVSQKTLSEKEIILEKNLLEKKIIKRKKSLVNRRNELIKYFNDNYSLNILRYRYVK